MNGWVYIKGVLGVTFSHQKNKLTEVNARSDKEMIKNSQKDKNFVFCLILNVQILATKFDMISL